MKGTRIWFLLCGVILIAGILGCAWVLRPMEHQLVEVLQDGAVIYTFDLSAAEDQAVEVPSEYGGNIIQIQDGSIRVSSADCPDQTCVQMGALSDTGLPIVCLPHRLVIQYVEADTDGATG